MQQREEVQLLKGRLQFLCYIIVGALLILGFGYWDHQMVYSRYYGDAAEKNSVKEIPLIAQRGRIYDRYNRLLADSRPSYNIVLIRENSPHTTEQTVGFLSSGIDTTVEDLKERIDKRKREPKFRPITLKEDISAADMAFVKAHRFELPEISIEEQPRRR